MTTLKNPLIIRSDERGFADHGWLKSAHTFSFGSYYNPDRIHFGVLRVINDDQIAPKMGFGTHPHDNMEIITIPLEGALAHKDSLGNGSIIRKGEVQVMSAGTGIQHSEFNALDDQWTSLFQIWILTKTENVTPRYDQKSFDFSVQNQWIPIVQSIEVATNAVGIYQDVQFSVANLSQGASLSYSKILPNNLLFCMVISGEIDCEGTLLSAKDALGDRKNTELTIQARQDSMVLMLDIPAR
jgi:redox-sensitive bicupin YhaK (pirin superfamily)